MGCRRSKADPIFSQAPDSKVPATKPQRFVNRTFAHAGLNLSEIAFRDIVQSCFCRPGIGISHASRSKFSALSGASCTEQPQDIL